MAVKRVKPARTPQLKIVLPHTLAASPHARYQPRVVRSPAAHAPGVRSGRSCHTQPTRPGKSPVRPAAGSGRSSHTRLQQPASRSASGRVLSPPYAAVWPNARSTGARGQRASRPASGAHPTRGRPVCCRHVLVRARPVHQPARAAKARRKPSPHAASGSAISTATVTQQHPPATVYLSRRCATGLQRFSYRRQSCPHGAMSAGDSSRGLLSERPSFLQAEHG